MNTTEDSRVNDIREQRGDRENRLLLILLVTVGYAWTGICPPYAVTCGLSRGYAQSMVSLAVSTEMLCLILGNVFWGRMADRLRTNKRVLLLCLAIASAGELALFTGRSYGVYLAGFCVMGSVMGASGVLMDTWVLRQFGSNIAKYGNIRSFGAIGYAAAMLLSGVVIEKKGYAALVLLAYVLAAAAAGIALLIREKPWENAEEGPKEKPDPVGKGEGKGGGRPAGGFIPSAIADRIPVADREYLFWLLLLFLAGLAIAPCNSFKIVILEKTGGNVANQGLDGFLGCTVQFFLFFLVGRLSRIPARKRMLIVTLAISAGIVLYITAASPVQVYLGSIMIHGVYSIVNPATRDVVSRRIRPDRRVMATGIGDACYGNLSNMLIMTVAGTVSGRFGMNAMLAVCLVFSLAAAALCLMPERKRSEA